MPVPVYNAAGLRLSYRCTVLPAKAQKVKSFRIHDFKLCKLPKSKGNI